MTLNQKEVNKHKRDLVYDCTMLHVHEKSRVKLILFNIVKINRTRRLPCSCFEEVRFAVHQFRSEFRHFFLHFSHFSVEPLPDVAEFCVDHAEIAQFNRDVSFHTISHFALDKKSVGYLSRSIQKVLKNRARLVKHCLRSKLLLFLAHYELTLTRACSIWI